MLKNESLSVPDCSEEERFASAFNCLSFFSFSRKTAKSCAADQFFLSSTIFLINDPSVSSLVILILLNNSFLYFVQASHSVRVCSVLSVLSVAMRTNISVSFTDSIKKGIEYAVSRKQLGKAKTHVTVSSINPDFPYRQNGFSVT